MIITCLILSILSLAVAVVTYIRLTFSNNILMYMLMQMNEKQNEAGIPTIEFKRGIDHSWMMVQIAMFKMQDDKDILDSDSILSCLSRNLEFLSTHPGDLKKWNVQYIEYLKKKKELEDTEHEILGDGDSSK